MPMYVYNYMYVDRCTTWSERNSKRNTMASYGHESSDALPNGPMVQGEGEITKPWDFWRLSHQIFIKSPWISHEYPMNIPWISHKYPETQLQWLHIKCSMAVSSSMAEEVQTARGRRSGTWSPVAIFCNEWCKTPFYYQCYIIIIFIFILVMLSCLLLIHVFPCLSMSFDFWPFLSICLH